jgi:hypothetical protein
VLVGDFDYMAILGQGGFGRVVHVRKRSTGMHFAMKIQPKQALYEEHDGNLANLHTEKTVFANCHHPFVVDMCYALQTPEHALLVLSLVDGGDLNDLLWRAPQGKLDEVRAAGVRRARDEREDASCEARGRSRTRGWQQGPYARKFWRRTLISRKRALSARTEKDARTWKNTTCDSDSSLTLFLICSP